MTPVRNLVLGSAGLVGRSLCRYLTKKGDDVYEFDIRNGPPMTNDLRSAKLSWLNDFDRIYFLAWDVGGSKYLYRENNQLQQLEWNLAILSNVMPQLQKSGVPFLFVSSQHAGRYTAYGQTKRIGEYWAQSIGGTVVRLWNIYGEKEEDGEKTHVMGDMISQALSTGEIHLLTTGEEERWFIYEEDACMGIELAMNTRPTEIYDIAGYSPTRISRLAKMVVLETNASLFYGTLVSESDDQHVPVLLPGFTPKIYLREGIRRMVERYRGKQE